MRHLRNQSEAQKVPFRKVGDIVKREMQDQLCSECIDTLFGCKHCHVSKNGLTRWLIELTALMHRSTVRRI